MMKAGPEQLQTGCLTNPFRGGHIYRNASAGWYFQIPANFPRGNWREFERDPSYARASINMPTPKGVSEPERASRNPTHSSKRLRMSNAVAFHKLVTTLIIGPDFIAVWISEHLAAASSDFLSDGHSLRIRQRSVAGLLKELASDG